MNLKLTKRVKRQLVRLRNSDPKLTKKIANTIYLIGNNPYLKGSLKLTRYHGYRFKVKNYRILYRVDMNNKIVTIVAVVHRKDAYRNLDSLDL